MDYDDMIIIFLIEMIVQFFIFLSLFLISIYFHLNMDVVFKYNLVFTMVRYNHMIFENSVIHFYYVRLLLIINFEIYENFSFFFAFSLKLFILIY
jgi:hypothetical protein